MHSPNHELYRSDVRSWIQAHKDNPQTQKSINAYAEAALVLWHLDLEPARALLQKCYSSNPRGSKPRDPVIMLRSLLLSLLVKQPSINDWVEKDLRGNVLLQILSGFSEGDTPGVGTYYDFLHRIQDGQNRLACEHFTPPSLEERKRAKTPRQRISQTKKKAKRLHKHGKRKSHSPEEANKSKTEMSKTAELVSVLRECQTQPNSNDMLTRLSQFLLEIAVKVSMKKGLLGDLDNIHVQGDGSPLRTFANRHGRRTCSCPKHTKCHCPRTFSDPDANIGWDHYREQYFFGHHIYEMTCTSKGHDLPLALYLDKGSTSDFIASLHTIEHLRKQLRDEMQGARMASMALDSGHDAEPIYDYLVGHGITPVIVLSKEAPATHPKREGLSLSPRGVPLCPAGCEMAFHGQSKAGEQLFVCPVKAKKRTQCPNAPENYPGYRCRPIDALGPTVTIQTKDFGRLFPPLPRNHEQFKKLYAKRSGCERSFSMKKERFLLEQAKHRRKSFWLIRLHLIAILQHALAWVSHEDRHQFVNELLGVNNPDLNAA